VTEERREGRLGALRDNRPNARLWGADFAVPFSARDERAHERIQTSASRNQNPLPYRSFLFGNKPIHSLFATPSCGNE
jgi:hypothetical protein